MQIPLVKLVYGLEYKSYTVRLRLSGEFFKIQSVLNSRKRADNEGVKEVQLEVNP